MASSKNIIYANTDQLDKMVEMLKGYPTTAGKVMNRVLSRAAETVRVETGRQIPKVFGAPQKEVKNAFSGGRRKVKTIVGAVGEGSVSVEVVGKPLTAARFRHTPTTPSTAAKSQSSMGEKKKRVRRARQSKVMIYRDRGMKTLGPITGVDGKLKSVFLAPTGSKNATGMPYIFFRRTGVKNSEGHEGIRSITTLSIPQMVTNEKVAHPLLEKVNETIGKRLEHELNQEFGSLGTNLGKVE